MPSLSQDTSGTSFTDVALSLAARYVHSEPAESLLERLVPVIKTWTGSALAFAATVKTDTQLMVQLATGTGDTRLRELDALWSALLTQRQPIIWTTEPGSDLASLMGWPLIHGNRVVGVVALANRAEGYDHDVLRSLQAGLTMVAGMLATSLMGQAVYGLYANDDPLRVSGHQYRQIFEAAGVGIALVSTQGRLLDVNQRFADITGRARDGLVGLSYLDITHPQDWASDQAMIESTLQGQRDRYSLDKRYVRPNGDILWVALTVVLVRDAQGKPLHFVSVVEDISERRRYQEAMTSAKAAERASKAKTEFLSRMSHELRTPLNAMLGFAQLLRVDSRNPINDNQKQKVHHIETAGAHLLAMLTDVLDLSRIEAGSLPLSMETIAINEVLEEAASLVSHQVDTHQLQLQINLPDSALHVRADQVRLRQILVNLLSNAIKYNRPQGRIMLEAMALPPHVLITVSDTGKGLSPEQQKHLFEPFNRLGAERTNIEGTGIGLVIVKRLVDLMHGRLEVSSTVDQGSSFRIWLPQAKSPVPSDTEPHDGYFRSSKISGFGALDGAGHGQMSVLYAEDNPINIELVKQVVRMRPQWHLEVAHNGAQAIDMALSNPPDLLLLDMHLGDMNGTEVSDALCRHAHTANIPRVALSADVMPDQIREARDRGFADYLSKPLEVARLLAVLDRCAQLPDEPDDA